MIRVLVLVALMSPGHAAADAATHAKPHNATVAHASRAKQPRGMRNHQARAITPAERARLRAALKMPPNVKTSATPKGNLRHPILTPEDRVRDKTFHPFLTPERKKQAKVILIAPEASPAPGHKP